MSGVGAPQRLDGYELVGRSEDACARHIRAGCRPKRRDGRDVDLNSEAAPITARHDVRNGWYWTSSNGLVNCKERNGLYQMVRCARPYIRHEKSAWSGKHVCTTSGQWPGLTGPHHRRRCPIPGCYHWASVTGGLQGALTYCSPPRFFAVYVRVGSRRSRRWNARDLLSIG